MTRRPIAVVVLFGCCALGGARISAQSHEKPLPSRVVGTGSERLPPMNASELEQRLREARQWIAEYTEWKRWSDTWRNRREPGWLHPQDRRKRPDPPPWLADDCRAQAATEGTMADACRLLADWRDDLATSQMRAEMKTRRTQDEAPTKTLWWEHVHFDALWAMPQLNSAVFGVVGMHATMEVAGRFQVFIAPGAIVLNLPTPRGTREWKPATDWGIAYRVFDFTFPGSNQRGSVHLNLAKAWVFGGPANTIRTGVDLAGFSLTLKKPPRTGSP